MRHLLALYKVDDRTERKRILELCEALISAAISMKTERKHAVVLGVLSVLEAYSAAIAARKLREIVEEQKFRERQMPLFNRQTGEEIR